MNVEIGEVTSTVRAVDSEALLSPRMMQRLVAAVADEIQARDQHDARVRAERRVTGGVSAERDEEAA
ncbi:MAG TPA: hypothetical protein VFP44_21950 [Usitatibacter sp.]|nr:hypothetical protein [Usitatibacter sp.]